MLWFHRKTTGWTCVLLFTGAGVLLAGVSAAHAASGPHRRHRIAPKARAARPFRYQMATALDRAALRLLRRGRHRRALRLWRRALHRYRRRYGALDRRVLRTARRIALLSYALGDYATAERHFRHLLRARRRRSGGSKRRLAVALRDLGTVLMAKGEYRQAEKHLRAALGLSAGGPARTRALVLSDLGGVLCEQRRYAEARPLLERALALQGAARALPAAEHALVLNNLGLVLEAAREWAAARRRFERALALMRPREPEGMALTPMLSNLALLHHARGRYRDAEGLLRQVLAIQRKHLPEIHPAIATTWLNLAWMAMARLHPSRGVAAAVRGLALRERFLSHIVANGAEAQKLAYLRKVRAEEDFALSLYFSHQVPETARLAFETVLRRKGRVLDAVAEGMHSLRRRLDPISRRLLARLRRSRARMASLVLAGARERGRRGPAPTLFPRATAGALAGKRWRNRLRSTFGTRRRRSPGSRLPALERLLAEARALERRLAQRSAVYRSRLAPLTLERVQAAVPADAALVEVVWYRPLRPRAAVQEERWAPPRYAAAVLRTYGSVAWVDLGPAARIERSLHRLRRALGRQGGTSEEFVRQRGRYLYRRLLAPLEPKLVGAKMLYWSPDGALNLLPLGTLVDGAGRYLIEGRTFTLVSSGRDLLAWRGPRPPAGRALLVADPSFGPASREEPPKPGKGRRSAALGTPSFTPLPGTRGEGEALAALVPGLERLAGPTATEHALKQAHAPLILHIATHGFFLDGASGLEGASAVRADSSGGAMVDENPLLRAGLALAGANRLRSGDEDGILTALEVAGLDLEGTALVVLSACETGLGRVLSGEGVFGLRRALVIAGAQSQVLSLWKVDDQATRRLMVEFYRRLRGGRGPAAALREAQLELLRHSRWRHPSYWAAFVPSGRPSPLAWAVRGRSARGGKVGAGR